MGPARPYALFKKRSRRVVLILLLFESGNELGSIKLLLNFFFLASEFAAAFPVQLGSLAPVHGDSKLGVVFFRGGIHL